MAATDMDKPWYRQLWPWLVMIPPAAAVVGGFVTAWLAGGPPALVVDDYGEIAMATAARVERDDRARDLGLSASLRLSRADGGVQVILSGDAVAGATELELQLVHPTREELDRRAVLAGRDGAFAGQVDCPPGRFYVQLTDAAQTWRLVGELAPEAGVLELRPHGATP